MTTLLLMQLSIHLPRMANLDMITEESASSQIGFIVLGIIILPVLLLTVAGIFEFPKRSRLPELFLGSFVLIIGSMVFGLALLGILLKFVVPQ